MRRVVVIDEKVKRRIGILCVIPALSFFISLVYYLVLLLPLTHGHPPPKSFANITFNNYTTLFTMLAISSVISAGVLIYCIVHLVRREDINNPTKMSWILVLVIFVPESFILFWYFIVKKEPKIMEVSDIG
jgi:hypothetical protein